MSQPPDEPEEQPTPPPEMPPTDPEALEVVEGPHDFFAETWGRWEGEFERPEQGEYEVREGWC